MPSAIHSRNKRGFSIPQREWLRGPLAPLVRDTLLDSSAFSRQFFESRVIHRLADEHIDRGIDHSNRLWALLCFELWAHEYA
jgi:asparagine synthase (glutamine-hydrolysing)